MFNPSLTQLDKALTKAFMARLEADKKEYFGSEDFREYKLDKLLVDPAHEIGAYFARLKWNGMVEAVGEIPSEILSNNKRKVDLLKWHIRVYGWLKSRTLEAYTE